MIGNWLDKIFLKHRKNLDEYSDEELLVQYKLACLGETSRSLKNLQEEVDRRGLKP